MGEAGLWDWRQRRGWLKQAGFPMIPPFSLCTQGHLSDAHTGGSGGAIRSERWRWRCKAMAAVSSMVGSLLGCSCSSSWGYAKPLARSSSGQLDYYFYVTRFCQLQPNSS